MSTLPSAGPTAVVRSPGERWVAVLFLTALVPGLLQGQEVRYREELNDLGADPRVAEAFRTLQELEEEARQELIALTQIPAPPFQEEERARAFAALLRSAGADSVQLDEVGNVLAYRAGTVGVRTVVLGAHLDTVFPEGTDVTVRIRGDTLFAPGIGDDTRGLIVVWTVLRALEAAGVRTEANLIFLGSVGEEGLGDLRGVKHLFRNGGPRIDAFIELDGSGLGSIVSMALGSIRYRATFAGPGGHSWGAFGLVNPIHALGRAIDAFAAAADPLTRTGPRTSFNVGRVGGGTSVNSIPFEAWMEVDMRSESPERLARIAEVFEAAMARGAEEEDQAKREGPPLDLKVERIGDRPSGELDPETPLVQRAMAASRFFGEEPSLSRSSTNSNIPISRGIPAVTIGRGGIGGENHSPGEWWIDREGYKAAQRALLVLLAEAGLADETF